MNPKAFTDSVKEALAKKASDMKDDKKKEWIELCARVANEQDPEKFKVLLAELSRLGAALILPRAMLRQMLLRGIAKLSASRTKRSAIQPGSAPVLGSSE